MKQKGLAPLTIQCDDCHQEFIFSVGEQAFFAERNFTPPKRCPECRAVRKANRQKGAAR